MSFSPLEMIYSYFRRRSQTTHSAPASTTTHANLEKGNALVPAVPSGAQGGSSGPTVSASGAATGMIASPLSNDSTELPITRSGDPRAFEGEERLFKHPHSPRQYPLDPERDAEVLVLLTQQYSITSVVISHYRVKESYVEYVIECVRGHDAWRVYRRYQQFKVLDHDLKQICCGRQGSNHGAYGVVPVLPGSHWMDVTNQSPELVEQRRRYLEIYLQQLLVPNNFFYVARTPLYNFLHDGEVPTHVKHTGIQPLLGLLSTRTDFVVDEDGDDEAIRREQQRLQSGQQQQQQQRFSNEAKKLNASMPGSETTVALPLSSSQDTFLSCPVPSVSSTGVSTDCDGLAAHSEDRGLVRSQEATSAVAVKTSFMSGSTATHTSTGVRACSRTANAKSSDKVKRDGNASCAKGRSNYICDPDEGKLVKNHGRYLLGKAAYTAVNSLQVCSSDERLPPASANCAQCNAEFSSVLYPHRCFFCRVQFCCNCLQMLSILGLASAPEAVSAATAAAAIGEASVRSSSQAKAASSANERLGGCTVSACRQCAENYSRRLDRCNTGPGGGAYRGMQSTLSTPTQSGPLMQGNTLSQPFRIACVPPTANPRNCVGEESGPMMLRRSMANAAASAPPHPSSHGVPRGSLSPVDFTDFQLLTVIGCGTFGKVLKVKMRRTQAVYAMKVVNKSTVYRRCMTSYMKEEKSILTSIRPNPYIVRCHYAFQTEYYLVFVIDYLPGGELYDYIYPKLRLSPEATCIYAAELVLALECLHSQDVVHRDLKPENVVLAVDGHICLTDFGLARQSFSRSRRRSFVGSPEYVAPEIIQGQVQTAAVDWWSFGVMLYEMLSGRTPFYARNNSSVYDNVLHKELELPVLSAGDGADAAEAVTPQHVGAKGASTFKGFSPEAVSLLTGLLARDPSKRLQDVHAIKRHPFFRNLDWEGLQHRRVPAPCIPGDMRDNDVRHFKRDFVSEWASVPPLTNITRVSIEALIKCFDNFPVSRNTLSSGVAGQDIARVQSGCPSSNSPSFPSHSPGSCLGDTRASTTSLRLPPSVLTATTETLREPIRFFHSMSEAHRLFHGVWRVVSIEVQALDDGRVIYPWGGEVSGLLIYSAGGRFSLQLTPKMRRPMGPVQRVTQLPKEELCYAYCSYVASFGCFQMFPSSMDDGCGVVRHYAEGNLCPNLMYTHTIFQYRVYSELLHPSATKEGSASEGNTRPTDSVASTKVAGTPARPRAREDAQGGSDVSTVGGQGHVSHVDLNGIEESNNSKTTVSTDTAPQPEADASNATTESPLLRGASERRVMLHLSTRPQRALEQDFLAFTSLVFEKVL